MRPAEISIVRRGETTALVKGSLHCGTNTYCTKIEDVRVLPIRWTFAAACTPDSLDARGFAFDQAALDELVHHVSNKSARDSCEQLARDLGRAFCQAVYKENERCTLTALTVTVSPAPYLSELSVSFNPEDPS